VLIIIGWRSSVVRVAMLTLLCHFCGRQGAHSLDKLSKKFTLFFVPLFPISTNYVLTCAACGVSQPVMKHMARRLIEHPNTFTTASAALGEPPLPAS
jgi:hypothetical protein